MKQWLIALTLLCMILPENACTSGRTWVFFRDKAMTEDEVTHELNALKETWPARSLQRRNKSGHQVDRLDLPVSERYINSVISAGGVINERSRWLNAVSIETDETVIAEIASLPFVVGFQAVMNTDPNRQQVMEMTGIKVDRQSDYPKPDGSFIPRGAYGPSFRQADMVRVIEAHDRGFTGAGVLLGMLDTGFHLNHRAFAGLEVVAQYDFIFNDSDPGYDPRTDRQGQANHGTGCLSVIAGYDPGNLVGIAPRVSVALAKTELTGSENRCEEDYWVAGIEWLEWLGVDVVTSSLSYRDWYSENDFNGTTSLVTRAAQRACELGVVICNSAGNGGPEAVTIGAPSDAFSVLAVAATDSTGEITRFSSRGPSSDGRIKPDVAAMGKDVVCVTPLSWSKYSRWNGTSLSCPVVAGVVALVIEAHPDWSAREVVEAIRASASGVERADYVYGYGLVDAIEAIDYPSFSGRVVKLDDGSPLAGIRISLNSDGFAREQLSDAWGRFRFVNLPEGVFQLTAEKNGERIEERDGIILPPSIIHDLVVE